MKKPQDQERPEDHFIEMWRQWSQQPPKRPPDEAARRFVAMAQQKAAPHWSRWILATAAAALFATIGLTIKWIPNRAAAPQPAAIIPQAAPLGNGEVLMWIDESTPLYMTFQAPESEKGGGGKS